MLLEFSLVEELMRTVETEMPQPLQKRASSANVLLQEGQFMGRYSSGRMQKEAQMGDAQTGNRAEPSPEPR